MCLERRSFFGCVAFHSHVTAASSDIPTPWTFVAKSVVRFLGAGHLPATLDIFPTAAQHHLDKMVPQQLPSEEVS